MLLHFVAKFLVNSSIILFILCYSHKWTYENNNICDKHTQVLIKILFWEISVPPNDLPLIGVALLHTVISRPRYEEKCYGMCQYSSLATICCCISDAGFAAS